MNYLYLMLTTILFVLSISISSSLISIVFIATLLCLLVFSSKRLRDLNHGLWMRLTRKVN